jgi:hypothetical protein
MAVPTDPLERVEKFITPYIRFFLRYAKKRGWNRVCAAFLRFANLADTFAWLFSLASGELGETELLKGRWLAVAATTIIIITALFGLSYWVGTTTTTTTTTNLQFGTGTALFKLNLSLEVEKALANTGRSLAFALCSLVILFVAVSYSAFLAVIGLAKTSTCFAGFLALVGCLAAILRLQN